MSDLLKGVWKSIFGKATPQVNEQQVSKAALKEDKKVRHVLPNQEITIRKRLAIVLPVGKSESDELKMQLQHEAIALGFIFTDQALNAIASSPNERKLVFSCLHALVGANKVWKPLYPNFPIQVYQASEVELFFNAMGHYLTYGQWKPQYLKTSRLKINEKLKLKTIHLIDQKEYMSIFQELLSGNSSISQIDKEIIYSYFENHEERELLPFIPTEIPFKETLCQVVADAYRTGKMQIAAIPLKNATDVLRVATRLSDGDISLAENTRFKLTKKERRWIARLLEPLCIEGEFVAHQKKWKRLFHCLHIGTLDDVPNCQEIAQKIRNNKIRGLNSIIENSISWRDFDRLIGELIHKPGVFARRLDHILREFGLEKTEDVLTGFKSVIHQVDTRVLIQLLGHINRRINHQETQKNNNKDSIKIKRVALPKGQIAKVMVLKNELPKIDADALNRLQEIVVESLTTRFSRLPRMGRVWIDPQLKKSPVPLQMRSSAEGLKVVQRGSRLPMEDKNLLRFFVHWVGLDIDLSASFLTDQFKFHSEIAYYRLRSGAGSNYDAVHSGDITYAPSPEGACEFIDIDLNSIIDESIRYIAMDVRVYEGGPFPLQEANAGWMFRENMGQEGEVFDARTVDQRISIGANSYTCMVAVFDVREREVIWLDLVGSSHKLRSGNNVRNNRFNIEDLVSASVNFHQLSLYDLLKLHVEARGELVNEEEAELKLSSDLVFQSGKINSEFLV